MNPRALACWRLIEILVAAITRRGVPFARAGDVDSIETCSIKMVAFFGSALSWLLAMYFAAVWGAHLLQATVLFPVWASDPPKSLLEWLATPYAMRVGPFFRRLVPGLYIVAAVAVVVAVVTGVRMQLALAVAGVCGLIHLTMIVLIFLPTNMKLGLEPEAKSPSSLDPAVVKRLVRRWGTMELGATRRRDSRIDRRAFRV